MRRRVYSARRSSYPAYQRPRRVRRRLHIPAGYRVYGLAMLMAASAWWAANATALQVKQITITGTEQLSQDQVMAVINAQLDQRRIGMLPQRNLIWFDVDAAVKALREKFSLEAVAIQRHWPGRLEVEIREPAATLIWVTGSESFEVKRSGEVLRPVSTREAIQEQGSLRLLRPQAASQGTPIIYDLSNTPIPANQQVVGESQVTFFLDLSKQISDVLETSPAHYRYQKSDRTVEVVTQGGWRIIVGTDRSIEQQVSALNTVLESAIKNQSSLDYVDVRFGGKVYYR